LNTNDLIQPIFVTEGKGVKEPIKTMPGIYRLSIDVAIEKCKILSNLSIPAVAVFPVIKPSKKTPEGSEAFNSEGLIQQAVRNIKKHVPDIGLICDVALDPFTSHGHDGILGENGDILNDETIDILIKQSSSLAEAGADILAPSDMMDGRVSLIRKSLDKKGYENVKILSYAAKYASAFYGPFRDAIGSKAQLGNTDKKTYQMDPANSDEALREVALDLQEGADMVMIKPGMPYLDVIRRVKDTFGAPTLAYQVSGEYLMLKNLYREDAKTEQAAVLESLLSFKRAGADAIISYFSEDVARWLS